MTAHTAGGAGGPSTTGDVRSRGVDAAWWAAAFVAAVAGAVLMAGVYADAATGARPFGRFWAAMTLLYAGPAAVAVARRTGPVVRVAAVCQIAASSILVKLLRTPDGPGFSDEFAHLREIVNLTAGWGVDVPNALVRMAAEYPGMHTVVAAVARLTPLDVWPAAVAVVAVAHTLLAVGVHVLVADTVGGKAAPRAGAVAAVVYATNPSFLLFDTQVAYESFALPLAVWALVAAGRAARTGSTAATAAATLAGAGVAVSHHLTGMLLAATLAAAWLVAELRRHPGAGRLRVVAALTTGAVIGWAAGRWPQLETYLTPSVTLPGSTGRTPFGGTTLPGYEVAAGLLVPFAVAALAVWAASTLRGRWKRTDVYTTVGAGLVAAYLATLPLLVVTASAEGVRRTWAWTYLGVALVVGAAVAAEPHRASRRFAARPVAVRAGAVAVAVVLTVGGVAVGQNETYRLPGPYTVGNDARSYSADTGLVAAFLADHAAPGDRVLADRYVRGPVAVTAPVEIIAPSASNPLWEFAFEPRPGDAAHRALRDGRIRWLVLDARMTTVRPVRGFWFTVDEPYDTLADPDMLRRLDCAPYATRMFDTGTYVVWRIAPELVPATAPEEMCR